MADDGTGWVNQGKDSRFSLFGILPWLQRKLSFQSASEPDWFLCNRSRFTYWDGAKATVRLGISFSPRPYFVAQLIWKDGKVVATNEAEYPGGLKFVNGKVSMFRLGWRFDTDGWYILGTALKLKMPWPMERGY